MPSPYQVSLAALTSAPQQSSAPSAVSTVVPTPAHFGRDLNLPAILLTLLSCLFLLIRIITVHNKQSSLYRRWYETCGILVLFANCAMLALLCFVVDGDGQQVFVRADGEEKGTFLTSKMTRFLMAFSGLYIYTIITSRSMIILSLYQRYHFEKIGAFMFGLAWSLFWSLIGFSQSFSHHWQGQDATLAGGPFKWTFSETAYIWPFYDAGLLLTFILYIVFNLDKVPVGSYRILILVMCFFMVCDITSCLLLGITGLTLHGKHDQTRLGYYYLLFATLESNLALISATVVGFDPSNNPFRHPLETDPAAAVTSPADEPGERPPDRMRSVTRFWYAIKAHRSKPKTDNPSAAVIEPVPVGDDVIRFGCNNCNRTFELESHLRRHMGRHNGNPPYRCPECTTGSICEHKPRRWWWFGGSESSSSSKGTSAEKTSSGPSQLDGTSGRRQAHVFGMGIPLYDFVSMDGGRLGGPSSIWPLSGTSRSATPSRPATPLRLALPSRPETPAVEARIHFDGSISKGKAVVRD